MSLSRYAGRHAAGSCLLVAAGVFHATSGLAAAPPTAAGSLDSIQVTATRTPQRESDTLAPTTVITRADIERLQARTVTDLLRRSPGVNVTNNGGPGKSTSIFMRGTESNHVLVLVDGVKFASATSGQPTIQDLPVDQIERIEIVRGPRSSLYGSEAIGGVIQIFTRDGRGTDGTRPYFNVGAGSYDTYQAQAGLAGSDDSSNYNISLSGRQSHGFDACSASRGCFVDQPDDDGYDRVSGSLAFGHRFDNGVDFNLNFLRAEGENEYDGGSDDSTGVYGNSVQQVLATSLAWRPLDIWRVELQLGASWDESENYTDGAPAGYFDTRRNDVTLQNDINIGANSLVTLGVDYRNDNVDSDTVFAETSRDNAGVFLQYLGDWGRHHIQLAGRGDDNEQFGEHATGSATYGFDLTERYTVSASYGTAFTAPTFNDLYYVSPFFNGNPDLDPEESESVEIGLDAEYDWGTWSTHAYRTEIDDLIAFDSATLSQQNVDETRIHGVETSLGTAIGAWQVNAQLTWLEAENRSGGANDGNELPRRPEYTAQLDADRAIGRFSVGASLQAADSTYDDAANQTELDSYQRVDLRGSMALGGGWLVQADLNNLFNETYETVRSYNQPGRNVFVTLRYQPE